MIDQDLALDFMIDIICAYKKYFPSQKNSQV